MHFSWRGRGKFSCLYNSGKRSVTETLGTSFQAGRGLELRTLNTLNNAEEQQLLKSNRHRIFPIMV